MTSYYPVIIIIASIFIIILAVFTTRLISGGVNAHISSRNLKYIDKLSLGVDKSLVLIELDNHYYLMFISKNGAQLIDKLDSLQIKDITNKKLEFSNVFSKIKKSMDEK